MTLNRRRLVERINESYTVGEEIAHSLTHGLGAVLSLAALIVLVALAVIRGDTWHLISFSIYGGTLLLLYLASTLYHSIQRPRWRPILQKVDHACIYLFIAGTYTPFALIALRSPLGWTLLGVIWALAMLGILFKLFFLGRLVVISTLAYVAMGWLGMIAYRELVATIPPQALVLLIAGGVVYTLGVVFYALERMPYNHAIWHLFVLGGSACHFAAIASLVAVS